MRRRDLLAAVGTAATGLAGCLGRGAPAAEPRGTPTAGSADTRAAPTVVDHAIETVETACMDGDATAGIDASFGEATVRIDGLAAAPSPCHRARIASAAVEGDELRVAIGFESTDGMCASCVGAITYSASVDLDTTDGIDAVTVVHGEDGDSYTVTRDSRSEGSRTGTPAATLAGELRADPDQPISVENDHDTAHEIAVTIRRESGAVVYEATHEVAPGADREIYNLKRADPDGIEAFTIEATMDGRTESVTIETSNCYGGAVISVTEDGELYPYYAMC